MEGAASDPRTLIDSVATITSSQEPLIPASNGGFDSHTVIATKNV